MKINFIYSEEYVVHHLIDALVGRGIHSRERELLEANFKNFSESVAHLLADFSKTHDGKNEAYFAKKNLKDDPVIIFATNTLKKDLPEIMNFLKKSSEELKKIYDKIGDNVAKDIESFFGIKFPNTIDIVLTYSPGENYGGTTFEDFIMLELSPKRTAKNFFAVLTHELVHFLDKANNGAILKAYEAHGCNSGVMGEMVALMFAPYGILTEKYGLAPNRNAILSLTDLRINNQISFEDFCKKSKALFSK